jgi:hypothetical protein
MIRTRIAATAGALALMAAPAVAVAHGDGHHGGKHHKKHHHVKRDRDVTGTASATVQSFADGALTIALANGRTYVADVTDKTVILCFTAKTAKAAGHGGDDNGGGKGKGHHRDGDDDASTTAPASTTVPPTTGPVKSQGARCGTDKLVSGAKVSVAKLSLKGDTAIWKKVIVVS